MPDRVRIGIVGTSTFTDYFHLPALKGHPEAEVVDAGLRSSESGTWEVVDSHG